MKTKVSNQTPEKAAVAESAHSVASDTSHPVASDARELIGRLLDYEAAAKRGENTTSGQFVMLTASERQFLRAELVADYIRLCAGNLGNTPGYFEAALTSFCDKICGMNMPSHELIGTYLAAIEAAKTEDEIAVVPGLADSIRSTIMVVLRNCISILEQKSKSEPAVCATKKAA